MPPASKKNVSILEFSPSDLAAQITLMDLPIFKSITSDEMVYSVRNSSILRRSPSTCPNVQAMKRQFNQLTFWVSGQILIHQTPRQRAEYLSYFIRTAKCLFHLNNLHSSNAIVSALLSSSIYRLDRTWHYFNRKYPKDRIQFDKLQETFSDINNYEILRKHLDSCELPCIPYLGIYSRDMIYIQEAHHDDKIQCSKSTSKILEMIEKFQLSSYDELAPIPEIQYILMSSRYLDELQKFIEDANYLRSIELEPQPQQLHLKKHNDYHNTLAQSFSGQY